MFHAHDAIVASTVHVLEHVGVVDLAGARLTSAGIVADLEVGDVVPGGIHVVDEIALGRLLVVEVLQFTLVLNYLTDQIGQKQLIC